MRNNDEIIAYLDKLRKQQDLSLNELARETGMAKSSLSRYFNKTREFPINKVHLFAKALHTTSENILGFNTSNQDSIADLNSPILALDGHKITGEEADNIRRYAHFLMQDKKEKKQKNTNSDD
ncbi:helix-turn-helix transcriptional regulator [Lactobacillus sp. LL6]|uniref:helix-turn-helix domain-containing protein n=1 Tax=Lactobacillus sp. LL6 TaxID=2596827 RepID=UPI0011872BB9|nr:helix-turn-helix transcriptional regulator [Lactobacillus sp. LL6]TSO25323.1 helix-turn-helix transcriptional regulator [Lactobacillus sp. LL6]